MNSDYLGIKMVEGSVKFESRPKSKFISNQLQKSIFEIRSRIRVIKAARAEAGIFTIETIEALLAEHESIMKKQNMAVGCLKRIARPDALEDKTEDQKKAFQTLIKLDRTEK